MLCLSFSLLEKRDGNGLTEQSPASEASQVHSVLCLYRFPIFQLQPFAQHASSDIEESRLSIFIPCWSPALSDSSAMNIFTAHLPYLIRRGKPDWRIRCLFRGLANEETYNWHDHIHREGVIRLCKSCLHKPRMNAIDSDTRFFQLPGQIVSEGGQ